MNKVDTQAVSLERIEAIFGKDVGDKTLGTKEYSLKVRVNVAETEEQAAHIFEKAVPSVLEVRAIAMEAAEVTGFAIKATFSNRNAHDEALKELQSQPETFSLNDMKGDKSDTEDEDTPLMDEENGQISEAAREAIKKPGVMFYLRQRTILVNLILITVVWATVTFNYYMINF